MSGLARERRELHCRPATIAVLWRRGGTATNVAEVKWDEAERMMERVKEVGSRARQGPKSNSGVTQAAETRDGRNVRGWSDPDALPLGRTFLPRRVVADDL